MSYIANMIGPGRAKGVVSLSRLAMVFLALLGVMSCTLGVRAYEADPAPEANQMREYEASATQVVDAILGALVERDEYDTATVEGQKQAMLDTINEADTGTFSTRSVDRSEAELKVLVPLEQQAYISAQGGRYVVDVAVTRLDASTTRVELIPHIIATTGRGPLGGRPLPSNGALETAIFDALEARLAG